MEHIFSFFKIVKLAFVLKATPRKQCKVQMTHCNAGNIDNCLYLISGKKLFLVLPLTRHVFAFFLTLFFCRIGGRGCFRGRPHSVADRMQCVYLHPKVGLLSGCNKIMIPPFFYKTIIEFNKLSNSLISYSPNKALHDCKF